MFYILCVLCFIGSMISGFTLNTLPNGDPRPYSSAHCNRSMPVPFGNANFPCRAIEQDYGWPVVVRKQFTHVTDKEGHELLLNSYSESVNPRNHRSAIAPNFLIAGLVWASPFIIFKIRSNILLNREYQKVLRDEASRKYRQ